MDCDILLREITILQILGFPYNGMSKKTKSAARRTFDFGVLYAGILTPAYLVKFAIECWDYSLMIDSQKRAKCRRATVLYPAF